MESIMLQQLREVLANKTKEQFQSEWSEIKSLGLKSPTVSEFLKHQGTSYLYQTDSTREFGKSSNKNSPYVCEDVLVSQFVFAA